MTQHEHWECPPVLTDEFHQSMMYLWFRATVEEPDFLYWAKKFQPIEDEL